jgi:GAF domain-containing protein
VQPVFEAIVESAKRLLGGFSTAVFRFIDDIAYLQAITATNPAADEIMKNSFPRPIADSPAFAMVQGGRIVQTPDTEALTSDIREIARARGFRSMLIAPLMSRGTPIGMLSVTRVQAGTFPIHHEQLLQTFADQAVIAIENVRLFNATKEALEHQTATAEVLRVISRSMADPRPVFEHIVDSIERLFKCKQIGIFLTPGDGLLHLAAGRGVNMEFVSTLYPQPVEQTSAPSVLGARQQVYYADCLNGTNVPSSLRRAAQVIGNFSDLLTPMMWEGRGVGLMTITREPNAAFSDKERTLLGTFADQAVIAIENARLFNETREALERQTATADILKVIASSPSDLQPVFEAIAERSNRLIGGLSTAVYSLVDDTLHLMAFTRTSPEADAALQASFPRPLSSTSWGERARNGEIVQIPDFGATPESVEQPELREVARLRGFRSVLFVPLLRDRTTIGVISITRKEAGTFAPNHVQLLQTFADQAVIAIGNVRLFNEVQAKTADLQESLQQQTATADVLKVISRSAFDLQMVLNTLTESACRLCDAYDAVIVLREGEFLRIAAHYGDIPVVDKWPVSRDWVSGRSVVDRKTIHVHDLLAEEAEFPMAFAFAQQTRHRTLFAVPLMREQEVIGAINIRRTEVRPFTDRQIELVSTFADQAVIAIENARLFDEVRKRTDDLSEALQQQTATADVLKVIASSPTEVDPALRAIVEGACKFCSAYDATVLLKIGNDLHYSAHYGPIPAPRESHLITRRWVTGRSVVDKVPVQVSDFSAPGAAAEFPEGQRSALEQGHRCSLAVPLLRESEAIGAIVLRRLEPVAFTDKQINLLQTFADQAVIAIGNVRLFEEVQARTRELAASLDELRAAQDRLVQTEKLASLGQLTAGIAHEIKNPLNFVNNFSALSAELTDELNDTLRAAALTDKMREEVSELTRLLKDNLEKVVQHGKRADSIVKNMLLHSREGSGEQRPADINALVDESLNLAYHGARAEKSGFTITLQRDFDASAGTLALFPQEITRALLNLISNGFYAATKRKTENGDEGFEPMLLATTKNLGSSVEIRIRDNGTGIPADVREKMFNPFFTTKPAGEGTGLGLSMTHDIVVKQHGGRIDVATEPGQFTEFIIVLPRASRSPNEAGGRT